MHWVHGYGLMIGGEFTSLADIHRRFGSTVVGVIFVKQFYAAFINAPDAGIGDGDAAGVTGQVVDNAIGMIKDLFGSCSSFFNGNSTLHCGKSDPLTRLVCDSFFDY